MTYSEYHKQLNIDLAKAANAVTAAKNVSVVSHIDADGITAGSIASITLERLGIAHTVHFEKKISEEVISNINSSKEDLVWICDLGSGYLSEFERSNIIVTDHHVPDPKFRKSQTSIEDFREIYHINPHVYGMDGSYEICGAGMTYLLSKEIDPRNIDLAYLAVVGAVGDFQDDRESGLTGLNRLVLKDAAIAEDVVTEEDLRFFGRCSRPLIQFLQYGNDPEIPGISNNKNECYELLNSLNIPVKNKDGWRVWADLSDMEKKSVVTELLNRVQDDNARKKVFGEVYTLPRFTKKSGLRDSKEFATTLNSCGRYDDAETGMKICKGDLDALSEAEKNRADHRRNISEALNYIKENHLIRERRFIQYFDSGSEIRETVVGIVAGMLLNSPDVRSDLPIIAFADSDEGVKVSARSTHALTDRGLNLSSVMKKASEMVGGYGGGHNIAAGATIPEEKKEAFLEIVEDLVSAQII